MYVCMYREGRVGDNSEAAAKVAPVFHRPERSDPEQRWLKKASDEPSLAGVTHLIAGQVGGR